MVAEHAPEEFRIGMVIHGIDPVEQAVVVPRRPILTLEHGGPKTPDRRVGDVPAVQIIGPRGHGEPEPVTAGQFTHGTYRFPDIVIADGEQLVLDGGFAEHVPVRNGAVKVTPTESLAGVALTGIVHQQQRVVVADEVQMDRPDAAGEPFGQRPGRGEKCRAVVRMVAADAGKPDAETLFHLLEVFFGQGAADGIPDPPGGRNPGLDGNAGLFCGPAVVVQGNHLRHVDDAGGDPGPGHGFEMPGHFIIRPLAVLHITAVVPDLQLKRHDGPLCWDDGTYQGRLRNSALAGERLQCGFFGIKDLEDPADFSDFENDLRSGLETAEFDGSAVGVLKLQDRHQGAESGRIDMFHFLQIEQNAFAVFHVFKHRVLEFFRTGSNQTAGK